MVNNSLHVFLRRVFAEVKRAQRLFPEPDGLMTALTEEIGELAKAYLDEHSRDIVTEAIQCAAMAARVAIEGDPTLNAVREKRKAGHDRKNYGEQSYVHPTNEFSLVKPVVYIAHQLAGNRSENILKAKRWVAWAFANGMCPIADWIIIAEFVNEKIGRTAGLQADFALIERCDYLFLCGPTLSAGMKQEFHHAASVYVPVVDLVGLDETEALDRVSRVINP